MDVDYKKNIVKPGDKGYAYDKEVDFKPGDEDNEWDMSESFGDY